LKLLFTQDALGSGGAERSHLEILSRFSAEIEVVFAYFYPKHDLEDQYRKAGFRLVFLNIPERYHFFMAVRRLVSLIKHEKPDLLVSCLWRADIISRCASLITGVPIVGTLVNDSYAPLAWKDKRGFRHKVVYWLDRITARIPVHWIANSHTLVDSHTKSLHISRHKVSVIYRGRLIPKIEPKKLRTIRNFFSYGRLLERKGFQDAIAAFAVVLKQYPECTLSIFGEGEYRRRLDLYIKSLGLEDKIFLPGKFISGEPVTNGQDTTLNFPELVDLFSRFDCFLFPSWYEGFSGALVEAMMSGIPIICSNIPMNLEAVEDQESGLAYQVMDSDLLSQKIIYAIEHVPQMDHLGKNARERASRLFDINSIAKQYEQTLSMIHLDT
jgi:glycosyltransferase involved in cell wall biosynthesis